MLTQAPARGHLGGRWVAGDSAFGMAPSFRDGLAAAGMWYVLDVRPDLTVWPLEPALEQPGLSRIWPAPQTQTAAGAAAERRRTQLVPA